MLKKKPHPADAANAAIVAQAIRFDIALFLGSGRYATATLERSIRRVLKLRAWPRRMATAGAR